jgi:cephalosporin hydroxylase
LDIDFDTLDVRRVFDYDRSLLPNKALARIDSHSDPRSAYETSCLTMGYPAWNLLYYSCYCALPWDTPQVNVVETGTNAGLSSIVMAQVLKDRGCSSKLQTVDLEPNAKEVAKKYIAEAGLTDYVDLHVGDSLKFLADYIQGLELIHFAFLDSCHDRDHVFEEFKTIYPYLKKSQSTVFFDNTADEGVAEALALIQSIFGGNLVQFPSCSWGPPGNAIWQP